MKRMYVERLVSESIDNLHKEILGKLQSIEDQTQKGYREHYDNAGLLVKELDHLKKEIDRVESMITNSVFKAGDEQIEEFEKRLRKIERRRRR